MTIHIQGLIIRLVNTPNQDNTGYSIPNSVIFQDYNYDVL